MKNFIPLLLLTILVSCSSFSEKNIAQSRSLAGIKIPLQSCLNIFNLFGRKMQAKDSEYGVSFLKRKQIPKYFITRKIKGPITKTKAFHTFLPGHGKVVTYPDDSQRVFDKAGNLEPFTSIHFFPRGLGWIKTQQTASGFAVKHYNKSGKLITQQNAMKMLKENTFLKYYAKKAVSLPFDKFSKFVFYPAIAPVLIRKMVKNNFARHGYFKGAILLPFSYIKNDGITFTGYALFYMLSVEVGAAITPMIQFVNVINQNRNDKIWLDYFTKETSNLVNQTGHTVFVNAMASYEVLQGWGRYYYDTQIHSKHKKTFYIQSTSFKKIISVLKKIRARVGHLGHLEILAHGLPGEMQFGQTGITKANFEKVKLNDVFDSGATIRFVSCHLSRDLYFQPVGSNLLKAIGNSFLDRGGKLIASNYIIKVPLGDVPESYFKRLTPPPKQKITLPDYLFSLYGRDYKMLASVLNHYLLHKKDGKSRIIEVPAR